MNKVYRPDFKGLCSAEFIVFLKTENITRIPIYMLFIPNGIHPDEVNSEISRSVGEWTNHVSDL